MTDAAASTTRRTALYDEHLALGARMVPFAGFEMPVQYAGILKEHEAVRKRAGIFDLSHMAQFELSGPGVGAWADALTINHVANMKPGQARYNIFTNERGGAHDDVLFYRLGPENWLLVVNAANATKMWDYLNASLTPGVKLANRQGRAALIAVQGPRAAQIVAPLLTDEVQRAAMRAMRYYTCAPAIFGDVETNEALLARTGYTGEDGFEIFLADGAEAPPLWRRLLEVGAAYGLEPAGLGARDMLRLEAGMPLYGFELGEDISPLAGGQRWAVKFDKPYFVGKEALMVQASQDEYDRFVALRLDGRVPPRTGYRVFAGGECVGEVRSASLGPSVGAYIATALVRKSASTAGTLLHVEVRGTLHEARVVPLPFYRRA
ncbi:MAG TPA: glycine cleavage system aminomethyltransferase GcvT [Candidatus Acidoferrales bacterium]|nr:glycine cleavage system aminomethyltransferase GcvT [Candidatus Acidoferrales bacterium]